MNDDARLIGHGFWYNELPVGFHFRSMRRTITEPDLVSSINLTWSTEDIFANVYDTKGRALERVWYPPAGILMHEKLGYVKHAVHRSCFFGVGSRSLVTYVHGRLKSRRM
jgi:hypothetical protein